MLKGTPNESISESFFLNLNPLHDKWIKSLFGRENFLRKAPWVGKKMVSHVGLIFWKMPSTCQYMLFEGCLGPCGDAFEDLISSQVNSSNPQEIPRWTNPEQCQRPYPLLTSKSHTHPPTYKILRANSQWSYFVAVQQAWCVSIEHSSIDHRDNDVHGDFNMYSSDLENNRTILKKGLSETTPCVCDNTYIPRFLCPCIGVYDDLKMLGTDLNVD